MFFLCYKKFKGLAVCFVAQYINPPMINTNHPVNIYPAEMRERERIKGGFFFLQGKALFDLQILPYMFT